MRVTYGVGALVVFGIVLGCGSSGATGDGGTPDAAPEASADAGPQNDWSCVGKVVLKPTAKPTLNLLVSGWDPQAGTRVPDLAVSLCGANDGPCANPLPNGTDGGIVKTDATGYATLTVQNVTGNGFEGAWVAAPTNGDLVNMNFSNVPYRNDVAEYGRFQWNTTQFQLLVSSAGKQWDKTRGAIGIQSLDCKNLYLNQDNAFPVQNTAGAGVSFDISPSDPGIVAGYFVGLNLKTKDMGTTQTDTSGIGGFVNVPEGWYTITATLAKTQQKIGTARIYAKAGVISNGVLLPN